jgi:CheY-like chemotaxis protein
VGDDPDQPDRVRLSVRDNGIGIPAEAVGKVTLRYFTVGDQPTGSGLGLAISKEIVALHGGWIDITSPPPGFDRGTVVRISLPVTHAPSVLIVDDDDGVLELLADQIGQEGYRILRAKTGAEAGAIVARERPDVVVLDLALPDMDGTEFILKMRSDKVTKPLAIIVVTGMAVGRAKEEILSSFSIPALGKPWDEAELRELVSEVFMGKTSRGRRA